MKTRTYLLRAATAAVLGWASNALLRQCSERLASCLLQAAESLSSEEVVAGAMEVLRRLFGDAIPQPIASMVTRWRSDEYARGGSLGLPCQGTACDDRSLGD